MCFDCAQMENEFLRKRLQQFEERLDSELTSRRELEQQVGGSGLSASLKHGLSPPLFKLGKEEGGAKHFIFSTSTVTTSASHCGIWEIFFLLVGIPRWERLLCDIKNMNVNSGYLSSSPFLLCPCGNHFPFWASGFSSMK